MARFSCTVLEIPRRDKKAVATPRNRDNKLWATRILTASE